MSIIRQIKHILLLNLKEDTKPLFRSSLLDLLDKLDSDLNEVGYDGSVAEVSEEVQEALTKLDQVIAGTWREEDEERLKDIDEVSDDELSPNKGDDLDEDDTDIDYEDEDEDLEDDKLTGEDEEG